jgi:hypothetical protein
MDGLVVELGDIFYIHVYGDIFFLGDFFVLSIHMFLNYYKCELYFINFLGVLILLLTTIKLMNPSFLCKLVL